MLKPLIYTQNQHKKIEVIVDDMSSFGGREKWVINLVHLLKYKFDFTILSYDSKKTYKRVKLKDIMNKENIDIVKYEVKTIPFINENAPVGLTSLKAFNNIKNFDVIYSTSQSIFTNLFFLIAAKVYKKRFIIGLHGSIIFRDFVYSPGFLKDTFLKFYNNIQRFVFFSAPEIHVINKSQKKYLLTLRYKGKIWYIPYFIFDNPFSNLQTHTRSKIKFDKKNFNVIFVGRLSTFDKGIDLLWKIITDTLQRRKNIKFYIVGSGEGEKFLKFMAKGNPNIILTGFKSGNELKYLYKNADLLVTTSRYESFGLVILEAQLNGVKVISFKTDGALEIIKKKFQGFLVNNYDTDLYVKKLIIYQSKANLNKKSDRKKIISYINKQFNKYKIKTKLVKLFNS